MKTKAERITALAASEHSPIRTKAALEALSDQELEKLEKHVEGQVTAASKDTAKKVKDTKKALDDAQKAHDDAKDEHDAATKGDKGAQAAPTVAAAAPTEEEWLKTAPQSVKDLVSRAAAQVKAQKDRLVAALKGAQKAYTEPELQKLDVETLTRLAQVAQVDEEEIHDYSGQGLPVTSAGENDAYRNPPDGYRIALDKRSGKTAGAGAAKEKVN